MSLRIRPDGRIFCAALNEYIPGDVYIDDGLHYELSVVRRLLVTTRNEEHMSSGGEWWWRWQIVDGKSPCNREIDPWRMEEVGDR